MSTRIACLALTLILVVTGCSIGGSGAPLTTLRVSYVPFIRFAPLFVAYEEGYFHDQGIEVELVSMRSTHGGIAGLISGDLDVVGAFISTGVFNAVDRGARMRIVAGRHVTGPADCFPAGLMIRPQLLESGAPEDDERLRSLTVSIRRGTFDEYLIDRALSLHGLTTTDLRVVEVQAAAKLGAFAAGSLDVAYSGEPMITMMERQGAARMWKPVDEVVPGFQSSFLLFGPNLLDKDPEAGRRFLRAFYRGAHQWNRGRSPRSAEILHTYTGIDAEVLDAMCWYRFATDGRYAAEATLDFQQWAVEHGYQDRVVPVSEFWDARFVEQIAADHPEE